jgi:S-adenosylmethionine-diacylgycerolhomoserine-N-methlytransferase
MSGTGSAAAMDRIYRHQRLIYDVTRKYYLLGRDQMLDALAPEPGQAVLEIGCGTGRNLVAAARRYPQAQFYGFDVSSEMLATASGSIARGGLAAKIRLAQADATGFETRALFGQAGFDRIFISYTLSMIPDWRAVLERAVLALNPGGQLHIVDFGQQTGLPGWFRKALFAWLAHFSVHPDAALEQALVKLAAARDLQLSVVRPWRGYALLAVMERP